MKWIAIAALVGGVAVMTPASAGDGPGIWNGAYVGVHGGWVGGDWKGPLSYDDESLYPGLTFDHSEKSISGGDTWGAGLQSGYNVRRGLIVFGAVADVTWTDLNGAGTFLPYPALGHDPEWDIKTKLDMFGTVRGRIGALVTPQLLLYGTGGFAWGRTSSSIAVNYLSTPCKGGPCATGEADTNHFGWAAGGGAEWALAHNWTLSGEYLFVDLGREDYGFEGKTAPELGSSVYGSDHIHPDLQLSTVRLGLNYHFGGDDAVVPLK